MPPTYDDGENNDSIELTGESSTDHHSCRIRAPSRSTAGVPARGLFDYALLAVLCAIATMLLFLCVVAAKLATGLSTMDTDAALESYVLHAPPKEVTPLKLSLFFFFFFFNVQCKLCIVHTSIRVPLAVYKVMLRHQD